MADFLEIMGRSSAARAEAALGRRSLLAWRAAARSLPPAPKLRLDTFSLIAEVKMRAPSAGVLATPADPEKEAAARALTYAAAGASAISVLTEPDRFDGDLSHLAAAASAVDVPCMRKDFLVHPVQVYEARVHGAGGVLLIAAMLSDDLLGECLGAAAECGLFVLLECFDADDLARATRVAADWPESAPPLLVGVNTRNLRTLEVDPNRLERLAPLLPSGVVNVAESGIQGPVDAATVASFGYSAVLVGSALMKHPDPGLLARGLLRAGKGTRHSRMQVKICGLRTVEQVKMVVDAGPDAIGLVLAESSRSVSPRLAATLLAAIPSHIVRIAVYRSPSVADLKAISELPFDVVQAAAPLAHPLPSGMAHLPSFRDAPDVAARVHAQAIVGAGDWRSAALIDGAGGGGLGQPADWGRAAAASRLAPLVLAGGLRPDTVADAIRRVRPWGVDVSSGVESAPGIKDPARVAAFIAAARNVEDE